MLGPIFAAVLHSAGGFVMPFKITGSIAILVSILMLVNIPKVNVLPEDGKNGQTVGFFQLMRMPGVMLPLIDTFVCYYGLGMNESMLGLYLPSIGADTNITSVAFFLNGGCYMLSTVVSGYIADKFSCPTTLSILGNMGLVFAFTIIGPLPFIPINASVTMILVSMALECFSVGLVYVSSFTRAKTAATRNGLPENTNTYRLISSMWVSCDFMGCFFGPSIAGIVVKKWGFRMATFICWIMYLIMMVMDSIEFHYRRHDNASFNTIKYTEINIHE